METEGSGTTSRLADVVQEFASAVVPALRGGDDRFDLLGSVLTQDDDPLAAAAVRVLAADALAPCLLAEKATSERDVLLFRQAIDGYPPTPDAAVPTVWSHWGMRAALGRLHVGAPGGETHQHTAPDTAWVAAQPWQRMTHQLAQLASLALPGLPSPLATAVAARPVDLARGFVRAVRRRDWTQAAGAGRWLTVTPGVPSSLGLPAGLEFVRHMGGADARVALHVRAAQLAAERTRVPSEASV
ncbi:hypothetical protein [Streptomyces oceani]|uniref:Uncharacterized protein n=1 Tax=Streptomyces oceani TaxID=1075402 RepID=A0A1E7JWE1_9ACTN|nr:hypothetical protein [Streptomyces oceani]OEU95967.1 hypothetical protein AN216_22805 [Streptomyces oceani]